MLEGEYSISDPFTCKIELAETKKKKKKDKRRFSDEQIRSLEIIFASESRLEPRKKLQLARELGLQPRQVAIWFQNKRARWKSKQLEKEFKLLRANYNNLASQCETLNKEKEALVAELEKLNELIQKAADGGQCCGRVVALSSTDQESDNGDNIRRQPEKKPEYFEYGPGVLSDNENKETEFFGFDEEPNLMTIMEPADSSMTSSDEWGGFESDALLDQSGSSCPWWDFWS